MPCSSQIEDGEPIRTLTLPFGGTVVGHKRCVDAYESRKNKELDDTMVKRVDQAGPGGPVIGHKVDAYEARKLADQLPPGSSVLNVQTGEVTHTPGKWGTQQENDMVKRVDQAGPGGPVDMNTAKDAIQGSIPLEHKPGEEDPRAAGDPGNEGDRRDDGHHLGPAHPHWGEGVKPMAGVPLGSPPPEAALPAHEPAMMREFTPPRDPEDSAPEPLQEEPMLRKGEATQQEIIISTTALVAVLSRYHVELEPMLMGELLVWKYRG